MAIAVATGDNGTGKPGLSSDDRLMCAYARGKQSAFEQLYLRYKQPLYGYLYRHCHRSQVDELFQDVWLRVIASASRYKSSNKFRSWIFTLAHNCLVDHYRKIARQADFEDDGAQFVETNLTDGKLLEVTLDASELKKSILNAVKSLPIEQREAFYLREEAGFSIKEIADIQTITQEAAKSRLRYAYKKLRQLLTDIPGKRAS